MAGNSDAAAAVAATVAECVARAGRARHRLMDIVQGVQARLGYIPEAALDALAAELGLRRVEVADMVSFYHFLERERRGHIRVRLARTPLSLFQGAEAVAQAWAEAAGTPWGTTSPDGVFTLEWTSDIGLSDQEPSALVNGLPLTRLAPADIPQLVDDLRRLAGRGIWAEFPSGLPQTRYLAPPQVRSGYIHRGAVLFEPLRRGEALRRALARRPDEVVAEVVASRLRGRGGAGFPTGLKWKYCRQSPGTQHYVICNADEGEPGAFKDRVLLTEVPDVVFEGLTLAGYAIGAAEGIVYLRAEYAYLWPHLQQVLAERRRLGLLGEHVCGHEDFNFDIRIQMGAGAYICGEETALIESLEGKRGAPRARPPFPTERGYLDQPTSVNNVETLACVSHIVLRGGAWFAQFGTRESTGTKLLSVAGDCGRPGVYEVPFGLTVHQLLDLVDGRAAAAVQIGGPSGQLVAPKDFGRQICYEDLPTGGSTMVFGPERDLLQVVRQFAEFFAHEACGWCVPCRVGTRVFEIQLDKILRGDGTLADVAQLERLARTVGRTSRCGLGQSAPNPILSTLRSFPHLYEARLRAAPYLPVIDLPGALQAAQAAQGRAPLPEELA